MRVLSPQEFQRIEDGVVIFVHPDQWIEDVPLSPNSTVVHLGENHESPFYPQWEFRVLPDKTIETVTGYFANPQPLSSLMDWYRLQMFARGWTERPERGYVLPTKVLLWFEKRDQSATASVGLQWWEDLQETTAMIRRTVERVWLMPSLELDEVGGESDEETVQADEEDAHMIQKLLADLSELAKRND